jgi:hypothetical protein
MFSYMHFLRVHFHNAPASYSGSPGLKSWPRDRLSCLILFVHSLQANAAMVSENYPATAFFQILSISSFTYHPFIRRYIVCVTERASINKVQKIHFPPYLLLRGTPRRAHSLFFRSLACDIDQCFTANSFPAPALALETLCEIRLHFVSYFTPLHCYQ